MLLMLPRRSGYDTLLPLLDAKNGARDRALHMNSIGNRKEFRKHQRIVKHAVDAAKEEWICKMACDAEKARKDGQQRWTCIRHAATDGTCRT